MYPVDTWRKFAEEFMPKHFTGLMSQYILDEHNISVIVKVEDWSITTSTPTVFCKEMYNICYDEEAIEIINGTVCIEYNEKIYKSEFVYSEKGGFSGVDDLIRSIKAKKVTKNSLLSSMKIYDIMPDIDRIACEDELYSSNILKGDIIGTLMANHNITNENAIKLVDTVMEVYPGITDKDRIINIILNGFYK